MNDQRLDHVLTEHRKHIAHAQRELYEHNIDEPCPCGYCERGRFETRVYTVMVVAIAGLAALTWAVLS